jgi:hypothetical protein
LVEEGGERRDEKGRETDEGMCPLDRFGRGSDEVP